MVRFRFCGRSARSVARWRPDRGAPAAEQLGRQGHPDGGRAGSAAGRGRCPGAGVVGTYATQTFLGMGAHVTVIDQKLSTLQKLWDRFPACVTLLSTRRNIERSVAYADVVVGAVLVPGERTSDRGHTCRWCRRCGHGPSSWISASMAAAVWRRRGRPRTNARCTSRRVSCTTVSRTYPARLRALPRTRSSMRRCRTSLRWRTEELNSLLSNPAIEPAVNTYAGEPRHLGRLSGLKEM